MNASPGSASEYFQPERKGPTLSRTHRSSWMISGWLRTADLKHQGGGTACMSIGCPDDFVAVRVGFPNITAHPWRISHAIACASDSFNNYVTPTGNAAWTTLTVAKDGQDTDAITSNPGATTEIEVRTVGQGQLNQAAGVQWTWTGWTAIRSLAPDARTGLRVLMIRALIPSGQTITYANGQLLRFAGEASVNLGYDVFTGGLKFNMDLVTHPGADHPRNPLTWQQNHIVPGVPFPIVQFLTHRAGIAGIAAGDSHAQGTSTTEQFRSYGFCSTAILNQRNRERIPFSIVNCAQGGLGSDVFFARFQLLIDAVRPSYALLPGWSYNDVYKGVHADRHATNIFLARLINAVETCHRSGTLPIILTPFPRDLQAMGSAQLVPWLDLRETIMKLGGQMTPVVDAAAILGNVRDGKLDGTYLPPMSSDSMHPNNDGHLAVTEAIVRVIENYL